ncbi:MAG: TA system antitoxin ParD family protein [Actinomycetota bacterium]
MIRASQPIRLPADLYEPAVAAAHIASRTVPQQIVHWARIGRELEMSRRVNHRAIVQVLAGAESYDSLGEQEQAIVREEWAERVTALREGLNYEAEFTAAGESYSELDEEGNVVVRQAGG